MKSSRFILPPAVLPAALVAAVAFLPLSGIATDRPGTESAANVSDRPLAPSPFNDKAILAALTEEGGAGERVERYKVRVNKGWLDKNRLSVTITAEMTDSRGERKSVSRNAVITFRDGRQFSLALE